MSQNIQLDAGVCDLRARQFTMPVGLYVTCLHAWSGFQVQLRSEHRASDGVGEPRDWEAEPTGGAVI